MFGQRFVKSVTKTFVVFLFMASLTGCVYLVVGSVGALGGYVVSPDTVEGKITGYELGQVREAASSIVSIMGAVKEHADSDGIIIAMIQGAKVTVTTESVETGVVRLAVKARKTFFPKIKLAQDVYVKIVNHLGE